MKSHLFFFLCTFLCFSCVAQEKQRNIFDKASANYFNQKCGTNEFRFRNGKLLRRYKGDDYTLIDTSGLIIYTRENLDIVWLSMGIYREISEGSFSKDLCGKIYSLDYSEIKKQFKKYPEFLHALKKIDNSDYYKVSQQSGITIVNELYNNLVKVR